MGVSTKKARLMHASGGVKLDVYSVNPRAMKLMAILIAISLVKYGHVPTPRNE
jgi:hypothetical protein